MKGGQEYFSGVYVFVNAEESSMLTLGKPKRSFSGREDQVRRDFRWRAACCRLKESLRKNRVRIHNSGGDKDKLLWGGGHSQSFEEKRLWGWGGSNIGLG